MATAKAEVIKRSMEEERRRLKEEKKKLAEEEERRKQEEEKELIAKEEERRKTAKEQEAGKIAGVIIETNRRLYDAWKADSVIQRAILPRLEIRDPLMSDEEFLALRKELQTVLNKQNSEIQLCCGDARESILKIRESNPELVNRAIDVRKSKLREDAILQDTNTTDQQKLLSVVKYIYENERNGIIINPDTISKRIREISKNEK